MPDNGFRDGKGIPSGIDAKAAVICQDGTTQQGVTMLKLVLPNEIHGFLRFADWLAADAASIAFFDETLRP